MNNQNVLNGINTVPSGQPNPQPAMPNVVPQMTQGVRQPMPQQNPNVTPQAPVYQQTYAQVMPQQPAPTVDPMASVNNLNKEEAMEEALSHTNQYSPFQAQVTEVKPEQEMANNKKSIIVIVAIVVVIGLFIMLLPQISNLFGWQ